MGLMETDRKKLKRAKRKLEDLKGFYWHLAAYIGVNSFITISKIVNDLVDGDTFFNAFFDFGTFAVWLFWGIGIFFHALKVYSYNPILGKEWEERQIQKYIEKDKREAAKFNKQ